MLMPHFGLLHVFLCVAMLPCVNGIGGSMHVFHVLMALEASISVGAYLLEHDFSTGDLMPSNQMLIAMKT